MAIQARLFDGTTLEFPDGTDPSVIDRVAAEETATRSKQAKQAPQAKPVEEPEKERSYFQAASDSLRQFSDLAPAAGIGAINLIEAGANAMPGRNSKAQLTKPMVTAADYENARNYLEGFKSERTKLAEQKTQEAEGFTDTLKAYLENPSAMVTGFGESVPAMLGGAGVARTAVSKGVPALYAAATGEGAVGSLLSAEQIRKSQGGEELSAAQSAIAAASGVLTGLFGVVGGKAAQKLGIADIDVLMASQKTGDLPQEVKSKIVAALKGAISESAFEELPQSIQEQIMQNYATGRPWDEGVGEAAAAGLAVAAGPGAIGGGYGQYKTNQGIARDKLASEVAAKKAAEEAGQAVPPAAPKNIVYEEKLNKLLGEGNVAGTNPPASGASADLSGEPDAAESAARTGDTDRGGLDGTGSDVGATTSGANAQPAPLNETEQKLATTLAESGREFKAPAHVRNFITKNVLNGDKEAAAQLEKDNPGIFKKLLAQSTPVAKQETIEAVKETPAFNEAETKEAEELAKLESPLVEEVKPEEQVIEEAQQAGGTDLSQDEILQLKKDKAVAKAKTSLGILASGLSKPGRMNVVPEEEIDYLGEVTNLFSAAVEAGSVSFQQASVHVAEQLKEFGLSLDDIKDYLEAAYSRATAGLRSEAKRKQESELEDKQIAFAAEEPARAEVLDQKEAERIDRAYPFPSAPAEITDEEVEGYEANRAAQVEDLETELPAWSRLSSAEKNIYSTVNDLKGPDEAIKALFDFRTNKEGSVAPPKDTNAAIYELNRKAASKEHQIEFPRWQDLTNKAQANFLFDLPKLSAKQPAHSGSVLHTAFGSVAEQLEKENVGFRGKRNIDIENAELASQSEQAREEYQAKEAKAKAASKQAVGKGVKLPESVVEALETEGVSGVLDFIAGNGNGLNLQVKKEISGAFNLLRSVHQKASQKIFKSLARTLSRIDFQSTVVTDPNDLTIIALQQEGKLAEYDPKTDTFYFTPEGMDEATILHEVIHAATVKLISQYKTSPELLTQNQRDAVEHLEKLYGFVNRRLGNKYANATENIYEFVAYAMTDFQFQNELAKLQVPSLGKYTLQGDLGNLAKSAWFQFTTALSQMYNLIKAGPTGLKLYDEVYTGVAKDFATVKGSLNELYKDVTDDDLAFEEASYEETEPKAPAKFMAAKRLLSIQKGFENNVLLEVAEVMNRILAAPEVGTEVEPLAAKAPKKPKKAAGTTYPSAEAAFNAEVEALNKKRNDQLDGATKFEKFKYVMTNKVGSYRKAVKTFQNIAEPLKRWHNRLDIAGKVIRDESKEYDNVYEQLVGAAAKAQVYYGEKVQELENTLMKQLSQLTSDFKTDAVTTLNKLQMFVTALHEPERRRLVFIKNVPLRDDVLYKINGIEDTPNNWRDYIFNALNNLEDTPAMTARDQAVKLRKILDAMIFTNPGNLESQDARDRKGTLNKNTVDFTKSKNPDTYNEDSDKYIVEAGYDPQRISQYLSVLNNSPYKQQIMDTLATVKQIENATIELNKEGNYWSKPVDNRVAFYGFKHYVPFKGKPEKSEEANQSIYEPSTEQSSRDLQYYMPSFTGGRSASADNPIAQIVTDAKKAAFMAANNKVTQAVANAVKHGKIRTVNGKKAPTKVIPFEERYRGLTPEEIMAKNTVFNYKPDGTIEVYALQDQGIIESLRQPYKIWGEGTKAAFRRAGAATRFIGQGFTRFNPFFAPWNAFRDTLTNLYNINVDRGLVVAGKTLGNTIWYGVFETMMGGGMITSARVTKMYNDGNIAGIEKLAVKDKFAENFLEYVRAGGAVTYLQGVSNINQLRDMEKVMKRGSAALTMDQLKEIAAAPFDMWFNGFENTARIAAYAAIKDGLLAQGVANKEAVSEAAIATKELANFEQTGKYGAEMGSLYMFARAQATGAVRAIDSLSYIAIPMDKAAKDLPQAVQDDPQAMAEFKAEYNRRRIYSSLTAAALFGMGYMTFMMALSGSGDDDQGENIVEKDDMTRWTRAMRIPIPGTDYMFQLPWGFGKGAFSAWGAQVAAFNAGTQSFADTFGNSVTIGMDSFIPLPVSRIPVTKDVKTTAYTITDTITPTVLRPVFEWMINTNGLGMEIQNLNNKGTTPDAFSSRVNLPEYYKDTTEYLFEASDGVANISPDLLHFFASSYINGISLLGQNLENAALLSAGDKEFNAKTDTFILNSFVGTRADYYSREFNRIEEEIKKKKERLEGFETLDQYNEYTSRHPNDEGLVMEYNQDVNGELKLLRSERKRILNDRNIDDKERTEQLKDNKLNQQYVKAQYIAKYKEFDEELKTAIDKD